MHPSKSLRISHLFGATAVLLSLVLYGSCSKSSDTDDGGGGGGGTGGTPEYYGLKAGTIYRAHDYEYVLADGRLFTIDSLLLDVEAVVGPDTTYHGMTSIPVHIRTIGAPAGDSISATVFVGVKSNGLYWHGIRTCTMDFSLSAPVFVVPAPINASTAWVYADLIPAFIPHCAAGLAAGRTLDFRLTGPVSRDVQGITYPTVYGLQVIYQQAHYEIWFAPNTGVIFGSDFVEDSTFTTPMEGLQVYEIQ